MREPWAWLGWVVVAGAWSWPSWTPPPLPLLLGAAHLSVLAWAGHTARTSRMALAAAAFLLGAAAPAMLPPAGREDLAAGERRTPVPRAQRRPATAGAAPLVGPLIGIKLFLSRLPGLWSRPLRLDERLQLLRISATIEGARLDAEQRALPPGRVTCELLEGVVCSIGIQQHEMSAQPVPPHSATGRSPQTR